MAWTTVETPNANYILVFGKHSTLWENIPQFDALILENSSATPENVVASMESYKNLINQAVEEKKTIWLTDPQPSWQSYARANKGMKTMQGTAITGIALAIASALRFRKMSRRQFLVLSTVSIGLLSPAAFLGAASVSKVSKGRIKHDLVWRAAAKPNELIAGKGMIQIRNAISTEKAESFIAPVLQHELNKFRHRRKPVIAMGWGAGHYGIKELLENSGKRRRILEEHNLSSFVTEDYPKITRFKVDEKGRVQGKKEYVVKLPEKGKQKPREAKTSRRMFFTKLFRRIR